MAENTTKLNETYSNVLKDAITEGVVLEDSKQAKDLERFMLRLQQAVKEEAVKHFNETTPGEAKVTPAGQNPETLQETIARNRHTYEMMVNNTLATYLKGPIESDRGHHADADPKGSMDWTAMSNANRVGRVVYNQKMGEITSFPEDVNQIWMKTFMINGVVADFNKHITKADKIVQESQDVTKRFAISGSVNEKADTKARAVITGQAAIEMQSADHIINDLVKKADKASPVEPDMKRQSIHDNHHSQNNATQLTPEQQLLAVHDELRQQGWSNDKMLTHLASNANAAGHSITETHQQQQVAQNEPRLPA